MSAYAVGEEMAGFERSRACFEALITGLDDPAAPSRTHAELEEYLRARGREVLRQVAQDHLDAQAAAERRRHDLIDAAGVARTRVEHGHTRRLVTVFGPVRVTRMAYRTPGADNVHPLDERLNLPEGLYSHTLRKLVAIEAARGSFDTAADAVERSTGQRIGKRQLLEMARRAATDIQTFYHGRRPDRRDPADEPDLLVLSFDGKGVVMRPEALREATAKAAAAARRKLATRLSPGEKNGRKRMAELAVVYDVAPRVRTPADIIRTSTRTSAGDAQDPPSPAGTPAEPASPGPDPKATGKWLSASLTKDIAIVVRDGFDEAARRDPARERTWVVLVDGNRAQIDAVTDQAGRRGVTVHIVVDFIHCLEYLWKAAWSFFAPGDRDAERWVAEQATKLLRGKALQVAAGIRRRATRFGYSTAERAGADEAAGYLSGKAPYLDYATALASGWPIATGVIEGACRFLVKDRMDITGARWGLDGAEAVLQLRALIACGDFDLYWRFHLRQEQQRIHRCRYQRYQDEFRLAA